MAPAGPAHGVKRVVDGAGGGNRFMTGATIICDGGVRLGSTYAARSARALRRATSWVATTAWVIR